MASTDARPIPIKNTAFRAVFPILDADGDLVTGATGLDSEVSKDQGTFADCTNEATEIATSSGMYYLDLTSTEMNADCVAVIVKTSSSGAKTTVLVFYPEETGDINVDVTAYGGTAGSFASGRPETNTSHIAGSAVSTSSAQLGVNVVNLGGSAVDAASGLINANVKQVSGDATAADNAEAFFDGTGYAGTNNVIPTVTTLTNAPSDSSGVTTLLSRLTATRAGYLDNLSGGAVALASKLKRYVQLLARKDAAIATDAATELGEINEDVASGAGAYANTTDAQEALRDRGDAAWVTATGFSTLTQADIRTAVGVTSANLDTQLTAIDDFLDTEVAAILAAVDTEIAAIKAKTDNLPAAPAATGDIPTAAAIADAVWDEDATAHQTGGTFGQAIGDPGADTNTIFKAVVTDATGATVGVDAAAILADTNELQTDLTNGGRLDLLIDAILADTGTDGVVISAATANQIADAILTRDWTAVSGEAARSALNALRALRNKVAVSGGTATVYEEDDSTTAWTAAVTTTAGDPISAVDPA